MCAVVGAICRFPWRRGL